VTAWGLGNTSRIATRASQSPLEQLKAGALALGDDERKEFMKWLQTL